MQTRTIAMIGASVGVAAVAATGVTYASAAPESAPYTHEAVAATAPLGGDSEKEKDYDKKEKEKDYDKKGYGDKKDHGKIQINERTYSADPGACIAVVNITSNDPLDANSFNISNNSKKTVQFFNGVTCDNGAPVATVGPHSTSFAVFTDPAGFLPPLNAGSFRVIDDHH